METEKLLIIPDELIAEIEILYQKHYVHSYDKTVHDIFNAIRRRIRKCSTTNAVEVVHAEWLDIRFDSMWKSMLATCSHCEVRGEVRVKANECGFAVPDSDYCPNCGAKMDGGN